MSEIPVNDEQLSRLADGDLMADELAEVLLPTLADEAARDRLRDYLLLRQKLSKWRDQVPQHPATVAACYPSTQVALEPDSEKRPAASRWGFAGQLAAAAALGGILVLGTLVVLKPANRAAPSVGQVASQENAEESHAATAPHVQISSEQQQQVADVFAFYESVAGPLKSYVDTEGTIAVETLPGEAAAASQAVGEPIAIVIRFADQAHPNNSHTESLVVVRENVPIKLSLPRVSNQQQPDVYVISNRTNGKIDVRYAISMPNRTDERSASVAGWKTVGLQETSLGGLALGDRSVQITASAWAIK